MKSTESIHYDDFHNFLTRLESARVFTYQEFLDKKASLIENVAKDVVKEIRLSINERSIKDEIINSIESKLTDKVKEELPGVLNQTIETLASRVAQTSLEKKMSSLLPDLAEDLIKKDLASIRKQIM